MTARDDYTNDMAANLEQWSTQVDELQAKMHDAGAEKARVETVVAAMKMQQAAYQEQMRTLRDASDAAFADLRKGSERMAEEYTKTYAQVSSQFGN